MPSIDALDRSRRARLGQFFTPRPIATFMASLFEDSQGDVSILDPGAGTGTLTLALVRRLLAQPSRPRRILLATYEVDPEVSGPLAETLRQCAEESSRAGVQFEAARHNGDFIEAITDSMPGTLFHQPTRTFDLCIMNPPYRKIRTDSETRHALSRAGIEVTNLYTAFMSLAVRLLAPGGQLVAITPRSFCNGPYFLPFRRDFLSQVAIRRLHTFESRSSLFGHDNVLQENLVLHAVKGTRNRSHVCVSSSTGIPGEADLTELVPQEAVVSEQDPARVIHVSCDPEQSAARRTLRRLEASLDQLGIQVSTGRVVDFRASTYLRQTPGADTVPLIYPCHVVGAGIIWPRLPSKKPNAIVRAPQTEDLLVPRGTYVLVKRFSSKEQRRRVSAALFTPEASSAPVYAFENHLNYFHLNGRGLQPTVAKGLVAYLNSTPVDLYFRAFSGHTQVNATDLRMLPYPTLAQLDRLGRTISTVPSEQAAVDGLVGDVLL